MSLRSTSCRIFAARDPAGDVKPIAVSQVAHRDLLDESFGTGCDAPILHGPPRENSN